MIAPAASLVASHLLISAVVALIQALSAGKEIIVKWLYPIHSTRSSILPKELRIIL
jgi:hypothetical protein